MQRLSRALHTSLRRSDMTQVVLSYLPSIEAGDIPGDVRARLAKLEKPTTSSDPTLSTVRALMDPVDILSSHSSTAGLARQVLEQLLKTVPPPTPHLPTSKRRDLLDIAEAYRLLASHHMSRNQVQDGIAAVDKYTEIVGDLEGGSSVAAGEALATAGLIMLRPNSYDSVFAMERLKKAEVMLAATLGTGEWHARVTAYQRS